MKKAENELRWEHLGVAITFNPGTANFVAQAPGKRLSAASLDAMRSKIEKLNVEKFTPFSALVEYKGWEDPTKKRAREVVKKAERFDATRSGRYAFLLRIKVVSLDRSEGKFRFLGDDGEDYPTVFPDTSATIDLWSDLQKAHFAEDQSAEVFKNRRIEASDKLKSAEVKAFDYRAPALNKAEA